MVIRVMSVLGVLFDTYFKLIKKETKQNISKNQLRNINTMKIRNANLQCISVLNVIQMSTIILP